MIMCGYLLYAVCGIGFGATNYYKNRNYIVFKRNVLTSQYYCTSDLIRGKLCNNELQQ